jgi:hypothetical protein
LQARSCAFCASRAARAAGQSREENDPIKSAITAGTLMPVAVLPAGTANAAPVTLQPTARAADGAGLRVEKAQWGYCHC